MFLRHSLPPVVVGLLLSLLAIPNAHALDFTVNSLGDADAANPGDGTALTAGGVITLRSALREILHHGQGGTADFAPALFASGPGEIQLTEQLPPITKGLTIAGPGANLLTLRATSGRIFMLQSPLGPVSINNLSMTGATDSAINITQTVTSITRCVLYDNAGTLEGGAIDLDDGAYLVLSQSRIGPNNRAQFAGGIDADVGLPNTLVAYNTLFINNSATVGDGGAAYFANGGTGRFLNCTFVDNSALISAGAIRRVGSSGSLQLINCTMTNNTGLGGAGGALNLANSDGLSLLVNTVVAENTGASAPDINGPVSTDSEHSFIGIGGSMTGIVHGAKGCVVGTSGSPAQPLLGPLGMYGGFHPTRVPIPASPLVNAGTASIPAPLVNVGILLDARGLSRLVGPAVDIGAVEFQPSDAAVPGDINGDGVVTVADVTALGNHLANGSPITGDGDINNDGATNHLDVQALADGIADGLY